MLRAAGQPLLATATAATGAAAAAAPMAITVSPAPPRQPGQPPPPTPAPRRIASTASSNSARNGNSPFRSAVLIRQNGDDRQLRPLEAPGEGEAAGMQRRQQDPKAAP